MGLWHLGSVTAACLAHLGHAVVGVDDDAARVAALQGGQAPLFEPGLDDLLAAGIRSGRLRFSTRLADEAPRADVVIIAYDTPVTLLDEPDLTVVTEAVDRVMPLLKPSSLLLVHSQVPVGTCGRIRDLVSTRRLREGIEVAYIPENLRLGQAIERFLRPDMIVAGAQDPRAFSLIARMFSGVETHWVETSLVTAEMIKHAINAFLATAISFGNEVANLCQAIGADATQVAQALHLERRIGLAPVDPGMGFAGGTLARDVMTLRKLGQARSSPTELLDAVVEVNRAQNALPMRWLRTIFGDAEGLRVGVLGLTYKTGTSTLRRSSALEVVRSLTAQGVDVTAADPMADLGEVKDLPPMAFTRDPYAAAAGRDALLLLTPWPEFTDLDYERLRTLMRHPVVLDMPNALDRERLERLGFQYVGVGRGTLHRVEGA